MSHQKDRDSRHPIFTVKRGQQDDGIPTISLHPSWLETLGLPPKQPVWLHFGQSQKRVTISPRARSSHSLELDPTTFDEMGFAEGVRMRLQYDQKVFTLRLGPVLAILLDAITRKHIPKGYFPFLEELSVACQRQGIVSYITDVSRVHEAVEKGQKKIAGWTFTGSSWKQGLFPIPNVTYNRISSRQKERQEETQQALGFMNRHSYLFNAQFLNKREVHEVLSRSDQLRNHLPVTKVYREPQDLQEMLKEHSILYLKPEDGSLGRGIIKLIRHMKGYTCLLSRVNSTMVKKFTSFAQLMAFLHHRLTRIPYIIQQGIHLATYQGRPVDFRILAQKNRKGNWIITSMVARVAHDQQIVSNLSSGGTLYSVGYILAVVQPRMSKAIAQRLKTISLSAAKHLDEHLQGHYGELGIDLALDKRGNLWILEVNAKPSKNQNHVLNKRGSRPSVHYLAQFVQYATTHERRGFTHEKHLG